MDAATYEQLELDKEFVGNERCSYKEAMEVTLDMYEEKPIGISLPDQVTLEVTDADPVVKGQTVSSSYKPATLENWGTGYGASVRRSRRGKLSWIQRLHYY